MTWAGNDGEHGERAPRLAGRRNFLRGTIAASALGAAGLEFRLGAKARGGLRAAVAPRATASHPEATEPTVSALPPYRPIRPPTTPLAVRSPYLSTWLAADKLPGTWPVFWNGRITAIAGLVKVDEDVYVWCGAPGPWPRATQTSLVVTGSRSVFTLQAGPVSLRATFFSPVDPADLRRQCVPMSYLTVSVAATDELSHQVSVHLDITAEWVDGDDTTKVSWSQQDVGGLNVLTVEPSSPSPRTERVDQASWGTIVWATDNVPGLTWQISNAGQVRDNNGVSGRLPNTVDSRRPRAISDLWPTFGFMRDLGTVRPGAASAEVVACLGHVRQPAVSYLGSDLQPYWTTYWKSWQEMLTWFRADLPDALAACSATDAAIRRWAAQHPGMPADVAAQHADITSLALRQAFGGTELVAGPTRVPFTDWYDAVTGKRSGFQGRPVVGGTFALDALRSAPGQVTGYWSFHDGIADRSDNGMTLSARGGAALTASGPGSRALALDGTGAHASSGWPVVRTDRSFTVAARVKLADGNGRHTVVSQDGTRASGFTLAYSADDAAWVFAVTSADRGRCGAIEATARARVDHDAWVHLAGVHDLGAGQILLYVDGVLRGAANCPPVSNASGPLHVGRGMRAGAPADFFAGLVDEVRTHSRALSPAEIASSAALPGFLLASYDAGEGAAQAGTARSFLDTSQDFSVAAWVRLAATGHRQTAISNDGTHVSGFALGYSAEADAWAFEVPHSDSLAAPVARAAAALPPRTGDWQHLVGVRDAAAGELRLYVDGRHAGTAEAPAGRATTGPLALGRGWPPGPQDRFEGGIAQIRVWRRTLSGTDVSAVI